MLVRVAQFRHGPAERLLEQPEHMLDAEPAQERLPQQIDHRRRQATCSPAGAVPPKYGTAA
jgi:hypothetical protein